jgi:hypothetical protein
MNIFCTDSNPIISGVSLDDTRISKLITESAQMIANCFTLEQLEDAPKTKTGNVRKHSYYNHPCSIWVRKSKANFHWLIFHAFAMENERINCRGYKPHFCMSFIDWAWNSTSTIPWEHGILTEFPIAISENKLCRQVDQFEHLPRVTQYRLYFKLDKNCKWNKNPTSKPFWYDMSVEEIINLI